MEVEIRRERSGLHLHARTYVQRRFRGNKKIPSTLICIFNLFFNFLDFLGPHSHGNEAVKMSVCPCTKQLSFLLFTFFLVRKEYPPINKCISSISIAKNIPNSINLVNIIPHSIRLAMNIPHLTRTSLVR